MSSNDGTSVRSSHRSRSTASKSLSRKGSSKRSLKEEAKLVPTVTKVEFRPDGSGTATIEWGPSGGQPTDSPPSRGTCPLRRSHATASSTAGGGVKDEYWAYSKHTEDLATGYKTYEVMGKKQKKKPWFKVPQGIDQVFVTHVNDAGRERPNEKASERPEGSSRGSVKWADSRSSKHYSSSGPSEASSDAETNAATSIDGDSSVNEPEPSFNEPEPSLDEPDHSHNKAEPSPNKADSESKSGATKTKSSKEKKNKTTQHRFGSKSHTVSFVSLNQANRMPSASRIESVDVLNFTSDSEAGNSDSDCSYYDDTAT